MEITIDLWKSMSDGDKTSWLESNKPANGRSISLRRTLQKIGVNDASYCTNPKINGIKIFCPAYVTWRNIITRCHGEMTQSQRPTYVGVKVCAEWLTFSNFRKWWIENQVDGYAIDKDIIGDGECYSPHSCIFIPQWLNNFTTDRGAVRGCYPVGVHFSESKRKFVAQCSNPMNGGKSEHIGYFADPEEAHFAWRRRKLQLALTLKPEMDNVDPRIYKRVIEIISNMK